MQEADPASRPKDHRLSPPPPPPLGLPPSSQLLP